MILIIVLTILIVSRIYECSEDLDNPHEFTSERINASNDSSPIRVSLFGSYKITDACLIGQLPTNGWIEDAKPPLRKLATTDYIDDLESIIYKCENNHFLDGVAVNTCFKGSWISAQPVCKPYCSPKEISSTSFVASMCSLNDIQRPCSDPAPPGTIANINCHELYQQDLQKNGQIITCGADGVWSPMPQECSISCGIVRQNETHAPWNVHFSYITYQGLGTIINARMVLTSAGGFWNRFQQKTNPLSSVQIIVSRYEKLLQAIDIERVVYAPNHNKFLEFPISGNIVVLVLRTSIEFNLHVVPICLPFEVYADGGLPSRFKGRTNQLDNLEINLPTNCYTELVSKPLTALDEICSERLKISPNDLRGGSGLAVPIIKDGFEVFYLLGIRTWNRIYDDGTYFQFQNVLFYKDFIQREISYVNGKNLVRENSTIWSISGGALNMIMRNNSVSCGMVTENVTKTPWNVRVENELLKGFGFGTIINARLVLTLPHVAWNFTAQKTYDLNQIYVTVVLKNVIQQQIEVERIAYAPSHKETIVFSSSGNIAAVYLRSEIQFNSATTPICLPFDLYADGVLPDSLKGRTIEGDDVELQHAQNCYSELNSTQKPELVIDVLCSNPMNGGDIFGSSFALPMTINGSEVFFLLGISTKKRQYDQGTYFEFQNVLFYKDFIQREIMENNGNNSAGVNSTISRPNDVSVSKTPHQVDESITCGRINQNATKSPWDVRVVFSTINLYTTGTIVSARIVLSVAYNFWDHITEEARDISKIYVNIVVEDIVHQQIEIKRVAYPPNYSKFAVVSPSGNIVVIVLRNSIEFTSNIAPICLPFELYADGITPTNLQGRTPRQDNLQLTNPTNCYSELSSSEKPLISRDVLCTNRLQLSYSEIEIGASFAVPINKDGIKVHYLLGLRTWHRNYNEGTFFEFQNVLFYKDFIQNEISHVDENDLKIVNATSSSSFGTKTLNCRADNIPSSGNAYYESTDQEIEFGEIIQNSLSIVYRCIENHMLFGDPNNFCLDGEWVFPTPECKPRCNPNDIQGWTLVADCQFWEGNNRKQISCTEPAVPGTIATIKCQLGYERFGSNQQTTKCGLDGRWSPLPGKCTSICGQIAQGSGFIVGGQTSEISNVPWHAGIYRKDEYKMEQVCGGSIISVKLIVSAIHCFWNPATDSINNIEDYIIAVGKSFRQFNATEYLKPQFFEVDNIFYEETYNDYAGNYANDIAVVALNKFIEFKSYIAPVCIQFGLEYDDRNIKSGLLGKVAGWGVVQVSGEPSPVLKEIEVPVVGRKECREQSTKEYLPFITNDKFCAGYLTGSGVCRGDSGGGLAFPQTKGSKNVYFLRGIVSSGTTLEGSCENDKYTAFTNVAYYSAFIEKLYLEYDPLL